MNGMAGRAGLVGRALASLGPAGLAAAAGVGATTVVLSQALRVAQQFEQAALKTRAVLRATGYASGQTADSIRQMSREIALGTLASVQGVEAASQLLLTFRSVSGDTFRRTLELSQDLAATGFGSIEGAAVQLGKALEDPEQGLSALSRVGVSFSNSQKEMIRTLQQSGRQLEAQGLILDAIEQQVGGAGSAEAAGLSGAIDTLGQRWEEFLEVAADRSGILGLTTGTINTLASALDGLNNALDIEGDLAAINSQITYYESMVGRLVAAPGDYLGKAFGLGASTDHVLTALRRRRAEILAVMELDEQRAAIDERAAQRQADLAQAERQREVALAGLNTLVDAGMTAQERASRQLEEDMASIEAWADHVEDQALVEQARAAATKQYQSALGELSGAYAQVRNALDPVSALMDQHLQKMATLQSTGEDQAQLVALLSQRYRIDLAKALDEASGLTGDLAAMQRTRTEQELYEAARREEALRTAAEGDAQTLNKIDQWYAARKAEILDETSQSESDAADDSKARLKDLTRARREAVAEEERALGRVEIARNAAARSNERLAEMAMSEAGMVEQARQRARDADTDLLRDRQNLAQDLIDLEQDVADREAAIAEDRQEARRRLVEAERRYADDMVGIRRDLVEAEAEHANRLDEIAADEAAVAASNAQKLRELRRQTMTEAQREADVSAEAAERAAAARRLLTEGDVDAARSEAARAQDLAGRLEDVRQAIDLTARAGRVLEEVAAVDARMARSDADADLKSAKVRALEAEQAAVEELRRAKVDAAAAERQAAADLARLRDETARQQQVITAQRLRLARQSVAQARQEAAARDELHARERAAQEALAAGDLDRAQAEGAAIQRLADRLGSEQAVVDAVQTGRDIVRRALETEAEKQRDLAEAEQEAADGLQRQAQEAGAAITEIERLAEKHDAAAAAAKTSADSQVADVARVEEEARQLVNRMDKVADGYDKQKGKATDWAEHTKAEVSGVAATFRQLGRQAANIRIDGQVIQLGGGERSNTISIAGMEVPGFATGGIMTSRGPVPLRAYEAGGIARSPQLALYGEGRKPEAYVPLPDGRTIPVTLEGGAGGDTYNITMHVAGAVDADRLMDDLVEAAKRRRARGRPYVAVGG